MVQLSGQPAGGPGCPVAVFGSHVLLLQMGIMGMVGWSALGQVSWVRYSLGGNTHVQLALLHCEATSAHFAGSRVGTPSKLS